MNLIDKVILEWSYRTKKGYPDIKNKNDMRIFESLFGIDLFEGKKPIEYLSPEAQKLGRELIKKLGLEDDEIKAHAKNRIIVYTDRPRQEVFNSLKDLGYEKDLIRGSSAGGFKTPEGIEIIHKAQTSVGDAGLDNEDIVVRKIKERAELEGQITVIFKGSNKSLEYKGVTGAVGVGRESGGNKKADIKLLTSGGDKGISIKKDGPFRWSSAMKTHGDIFHKVMGDAYKGKRKDLKLIPDKENPRVLVMMNPKNNLPYGRIHVINAPGLDFETMAFGSDKVSVVQRTFEDDDFKFDKGVLTITSTKVYIEVSDFDDDDKPIIQFERNASKASQRDGYIGRGITIRTVPISVKNKVTSRANNLTIDYNDLDI
tara:strand:- start:321 stop:1433 length:1113 start_codon:yes stop_codon:yes gene_type:complete